MIDVLGIAVYKITNILSNYSTNSIHAMKEYLRVEKINKDKIYHFNIDNVDYSFLISDSELFTDKSNPLDYFVIALGHFKNNTELKDNLNSVLLSFPIFEVKIEDYDEKTQSTLKVIKEIYVDQTHNDLLFSSPNPKFITRNEVIKPVIDILNKHILKNVSLIYNEEVKSSINNFEYTLNELKNAIIFSEKTDGYEHFNDIGYPPVYLNFNNIEAWVKIRDAHTNIVIKESDLTSVWYINNDTFDSDFELSIDNITKNPDNFVKWIKNSYDEPELILRKEHDTDEYKVIKEDLLSTSMESIFNSFANSILDFQQFCKYEIKNNDFIKNGDDLINLDLGFRSYRNLIGWIFFGSSSYVWHGTGIKNQDRITPYSKLNEKLPIEVESMYSEVAAELKHSDGLIFNIPDNVDYSFKIHIKKAFEFLKNSQFSSVSTEGVNIEEIENRLIELKIL